MHARFQTFISALVAVVSLTLAALPIHLAWATTAPWPLSTMAVPFTGSMQPARGKNTHRQLNWKEVRK
jgi:hypothetical protein